MNDYNRGTGYDSREACGSGCELCGSKWYKKCISRFVSTSVCSVCTIPVKEKSASVWTYLFVISIIIMVIVFFYRLVNTPVVTSNTIPDLLFGVPGSSDAYAKLGSARYGPQREYYI
jgi:hypothetical protein